MSAAGEPQTLIVLQSTIWGFQETCRHEGFANGRKGVMDCDGLRGKDTYSEVNFKKRCLKRFHLNCMQHSFLYDPDQSVTPVPKERIDERVSISLLFSIRGVSLICAHEKCWSSSVWNDKRELDEVQIVLTVSPQPITVWSRQCLLECFRKV